MRAPVDRSNLVWHIARRPAFIRDNPNKSFAPLRWIVAALQKDARTCPKTLILCPSATMALNIFNWLIDQLNWDLSEDGEEERRPFDKVNGKTRVEQRKEIFAKFNDGRLLRVTVSTALSQHGVNFKEIDVVVQYGTSSK